MRRPLVFLAVIAAVISSTGAETSSWPEEAGVHVRTYQSGVDDSRHTYVLYLPKTFTATPARKYPVVFFGTGYNGQASAPPCQAWADRHGWIFVSFDGRRTLHYFGIAERDFETLLHRDLAGYLPIDLSRVFFLGSSMGGSGAFGLGFRHPDWFASVAGAGGFLDLNEWYPRWCSEPLDGARWPETYNGPAWRLQAMLPFSVVHAAENGYSLNPYIAAGECDTVNRTFASRGLARRLAQLGISHVYVEVRNGGHGAGYDIEAMLEHFRTKATPSDPLRQRVWIATNRLEFARIAWAGIDVFFSRRRPATLVAAVEPPDRVRVETSPEIHAAHFDLSPQLFTHNGVVGKAPIRVVVDGAELLTMPSETPRTLRIIRSSPGSAWQVGELPLDGLRKRPGLEGPINHVFETPFTIVCGTAGTAEETGANEIIAQKLADAYNLAFTAGIEPAADADLPEKILLERSLVLVGTQESNRCVAQCKAKGQGSWPFTVTRKEIKIAGLDRTFPADEFALCAIYPSPFKGERYVLINTGIPTAGFFNFGCFAAFWLPDYVIARKSDLRVEAAGYFDERWHID